MPANLLCLKCGLLLVTSDVPPVSLLRWLSMTPGAAKHAQQARPEPWFKPLSAAAGCSQLPGGRSS